MIPIYFVELIRSLKYLKNELSKLTIDEYTLMRKIMMGTCLSTDTNEIMGWVEEWKTNVQMQGICAQAIQEIESTYQSKCGVSIVDVETYYDGIISCN